MHECVGTVEDGSCDAVMDAVLQTDYPSESFWQTCRWCWVSSTTSLNFILQKYEQDAEPTDSDSAHKLQQN